MKNLYVIFSLAIGFISFSQSISVNTNTYSVPELVKNILVNKKCITVNNITWRTGNTNGYNSTNGIGYFENSNPNFPLQSGVVLSTGNVLKAAGPNKSMQDEGNDSWVGDVDLEKTLSEAEITMKSVNATVLEFDFVPFSSNFNFQFVFASEEYGNFQCQFSDAFAFLLTNKSTGVTTNLAVVPGTSTPISVVTIRDFLYNSSCPSANSNYFGSFNGGSDAENSATNFNGQTVLMNATSNALIPNTTYHIKLVIADRKDFQADSAIFLGANSFNVGQDVLGPDFTVANKSALCENTSQTLTSGLDPNVYSFEWTFNDAPIGGNTPNLIATAAGKYGLSYSIKSSSCTVTTDYIIIEYYEPIKTADPKPLYKCNSGQTNLTFDLSYNTKIVSIPETEISYHLSKNEALNNSNPLAVNFSVAADKLPLLIWTRIINTKTKCVITKSFQIEKTAPPIANPPENMDFCESATGSGTAVFKYTNQTNSILGHQSAAIYSVSYYADSNDANTRKNPILTSSITTRNTTLFARIENNTDLECYSIISFDLNVKARPIIDNVPNKYVCNNFTLPFLNNDGMYYSGPNKKLPKLFPGDIISIDQEVYIYVESVGTPSCPTEKKFQVKIVTPEDINPKTVIACDKYVVPTNTFNMRYFTLAGGPKGGGKELFSGKTIITNPGINTIYTYFVSTESSPCTLEGQFDVNIEVTPVIETTFKNIYECISYDLPALTVGNYYTYDKILDKYSVATSPIKKTTTLYVFAENNSCRTPIIIFTVYIGTIGLTDINQCRAYTLTPAVVGEYHDAPNGGGNIIAPGTISKSMRIYIYFQSPTTPSCVLNESFNITINAPYLPIPPNVSSCESYILPTQTEGGEYYTLPGGPSTADNIKLVPNSSILTETTTIYIYKKSLIVANCYNEMPWLITINKKPKIDSRANIVQCDDYLLTPLENGNYFNEPNGVGPIPAGTIISERNKRIYIYAVNPEDNSCYLENFFDITVNGVQSDPIPNQLTYCESFTFPALPTPKNYYYDAPGGPEGGGNLIPFGTTITKATAKPMYYIYYETGDRLNCKNEKAFKITIADKPTANLVSTIVECDTYGENDGIFQFDLTNATIRKQVLGNQAPDSEFTLTFYKSQAEANNTNAIPIGNPQTYQNAVAFNDSVWIRVANNSIPNPCFDTIKLLLKVNLLPKANLSSEYFVCQDYETGNILKSAVLNTGLSTSNYKFEWTYNGMPHGGNSGSITSSKSGAYAVLITDLSTLCSTSFETKITSYNPNIVVNYNDAFDETSYITVSVQGNGSENYEYQIDGLAYQDSNVFNNISPGLHSIVVNDKNGHCNPAPLNVVIINYPKYFTPNGDGYNDSWNIKHLLSTNPNTAISIYDRYGKIITTITPSSQGWNGFFNGQPLPASDYWFSLDYDEKGVSKTFKSHFTLKR